MELKEAVQSALKHIADFFEAEKITNLGLEEVSYDGEEDCWKVTVGFSRPWDIPPSNSALTAALGGTERPDRTYKIVTIDAGTGVVKSITNR